MFVIYFAFNKNIQQTQFNSGRESNSRKMKILCGVAIIASMLFVVISGEFLSDDVRQINFTKVDDDSDEYDFEWGKHCKRLITRLIFIISFIRYDLECGNTFRGRTFILNDPNGHIYVLFGADDTLYWVKFTDDEYKNQKHLTKPVRLSELCNINSEYFQRVYWLLCYFSWAERGQIDVQRRF